MRLITFLNIILLLSSSCKSKTSEGELKIKAPNSSLEKVDQIIMQLNQIDSLIYLWIQSGNVVEIESLLRKQYPLDRRIKINNELEFYPIHLAIESDRYDIVNLLIKADCNLAVKNSSHQSAIEAIISSKNKDWIKLMDIQTYKFCEKYSEFLSHDKINHWILYSGYLEELTDTYCNKKYNTALMKWYDERNFEFFSKALKAKFINAPVPGFAFDGDCFPCLEGASDLQQFLYFLQYKSSSTFKDSVLNLVAAQGFDLNQLSIEGLPILSDLSYHIEDTFLLSFLIQNGADINKGRVTPLCAASTFSNYKIVAFLLQNGANPNQLSYIGRNDNEAYSALVHSLDCCGDGFGEGATAEEQIKTIQLLLRYGLDVNKKNSNGISTLDYLKNHKFRRPKVREFLVGLNLLK